MNVKSLTWFLNIELLPLIDVVWMLRKRRMEHKTALEPIVQAETVASWGTIPVPIVKVHRRRQPAVPTGPDLTRHRIQMESVANKEEKVKSIKRLLRLPPWSPWDVLGRNAIMKWLVMMIKKTPRLLTRKERIRNGQEKLRTMLNKGIRRIQLLFRRPQTRPRRNKAAWPAGAPNHLNSP